MVPFRPRGADGAAQCGMPWGLGGDVCRSQSAGGEQALPLVVTAESPIRIWLEISFGRGVRKLPDSVAPIGYKNRSAVLPVCTPVFTDMRAAQILHARMDFLGCPVFHTPAWAFGIWARSRQSGFGLNLVVGAESGEFQYWSVSIGYKNRSAVLPVCTPVFAGDTRRFCRPELF